MTGKKLTQFWKGTTLDLLKELEKRQPNIFQVSIHSDLLCLWPEALIDCSIALGDDL